MPMRTSCPPETKLIAIAKIYKAHGLRGELQLRYLNPQGLRLVAGDAVRLRKEGQEADFTVGKIRRATHGELLSLRELTDRNAAELWQGAELCVDDARLPEPGDDEVYSFRLLDCRVVDVELGELGRVIQVSDNGAHDLLHVQTKDQREWLLPFVEAYVGAVDIEQRRIEVYDVAELLNLEEPGEAGRGSASDRRDDKSAGSRGARAKAGA